MVILRENAFMQSAPVRPHVLVQRPAGHDVAADNLDQFAPDVAQGALGTCWSRWRSSGTSRGVVPASRQRSVWRVNQARIPGGCDGGMIADAVEECKRLRFVDCRSATSFRFEDLRALSRALPVQPEA